MDYSRKIFSFIISRDNNFILEYLSFKYKDKDFISRHDEHGDFKLIWELDNYDQIITKALEFCKKKTRYSIYGDEFFTVFFKKVPLEGKVEGYFKNYIKKHINKVKDLNIIFSIIASSYSDKRINFLKYLFEIKEDFNDFEKLFLDKKSWSSSSGSFIPVYEKRKLFWEDVEQLFVEINNRKFLGYVKKNIRDYENMIKHELKKDFIEEG